MKILKSVCSIRWIVAVIVVASLIQFSFAQVDFNRRFGGKLQTAIPENRNGVPMWDVDPAFKSDVFTFVRIEYDSHRPGSWMTDFPDADLNLSYRLQQLTSLKVDPN